MSFENKLHYLVSLSLLHILCICGDKVDGFPESNVMISY